MSHLVNRVRQMLQRSRERGLTFRTSLLQGTIAHENTRYLPYVHVTTPLQQKRKAVDALLYLITPSKENRPQHVRLLDQVVGVAVTFMQPFLPTPRRTSPALPTC